MKGVTIGRGAIVAAASVVTGNVAPFTIVAGNPHARFAISTKRRSNETLSTSSIFDVRRGKARFSAEPVLARTRRVKASNSATAVRRVLDLPRSKTSVAPAPIGRVWAAVMSEAGGC